MNAKTRKQTESIDRMIDALTVLRRSLPELERRNRLNAGADGYPSGSIGGGSAGGSIAKPTERAALGTSPPDPVRRWTRDLLRALARADDELTTVDNRRRLVFDGTDVPAVELRSCEICKADVPQLRRGRCRSCYLYLMRHGSDRATLPA